MSLYQERITADSKVMLGKPCVRGTRLTVELILGRLAEGMPPEELLEAYPRLTLLDIRAVLDYALAVVRHEDEMLPQAA